MKRLGVMVDCSRNAVMNVKTVKNWIDTVSDMGYNTIMLYTEDTYKVENQKYFGYLRGAYTSEEIKEIGAYAKEKKVELIPCIQTLAHLNAIFKWDVYKKIKDIDDILLAEEEETYRLIEDMFLTISENFESRVVHIGMDEAHSVGLGKYLDKHGYKKQTEVLLEHLSKVSKIAEKYGFRLLMWGDMFLKLLRRGGELSEIKEKIPANVDIVYWNYYITDPNGYAHDITTYSSIKEGVWFAGGFWSWIGFAPNNCFSIASSKAAMSACCEKEVENVFFTMWGDDGGETSKFSLLPTLFYVAKWAKGERDEKVIKAQFKEKYGIAFDDFMYTDLKGTPKDDPKRRGNPEKVHLFNDVLMGMFDHRINADEGKQYALCAQKLKELAESESQYAYLFNTLYKLCRVNEIKTDFGVRLRAAYKNRNTAELQKLSAEIDVIKERVAELYDAFEYQWLLENKPHGFDIQDIRFGTLNQRLDHAKKYIERYLKGEISQIAELEEELLDPYCDREELPVLNDKYWKDIVSPNVLSHNIF